MNDITKLTSGIMKKFIHQLIKFRLGQIFGIFTDCFYGCSFLNQQMGSCLSFFLFLCIQIIQGSLDPMLCLFLLKLCLFQCSFCFFNLIKCFLSIFLKCFLLRHIVLFLLFQFFPFLCYGIGISAGRGTLLRMDHPQTLSEFPFRKMLLP